MITLRASERASSNVLKVPRIFWRYLVSLNGYHYCSKLTCFSRMTSSVFCCAEEAIDLLCNIYKRIM